MAARILDHGQRLLEDAQPHDADTHGGRDASTDGAAESRLTNEQVAATMQATLAAGVVDASADASGQRHLRFVALGDTSVWLFNARDGLRPLTPVKNEGEGLASSATAALPFLPPQPVVATSTSLEDDAVFIMTDGVADALGSGTGLVADFLTQMWNHPPDYLSFAAHVDFARKSFDDDRTVIGLWPATAETR